MVDAGSRFEIAGPGDKQIGYYSHRYDNAVGSLTNRGIITWSGTGKMIDGNTGSINNEGTFNVRTDAVMQGRMNNTGILDIGALSGILDIGAPSGSLNFGGASIVLANSGTLKTELAGPTPDSTVGRIISGGVVSVAGKLEVRLAGGYQPNPGDLFPIINKGNGTFSNIKMPRSQLYLPQCSTTLAELDWCHDTVEHRIILDPETSTETVTVRSSHPMVEGDDEFIRLKVSLKPG